MIDNYIKIMKLLDLVKGFFESIMNYFKGLFSPSPIIEVDTTGNIRSVVLSFYSSIPGYCIKNFILYPDSDTKINIGDISMKSNETTKIKIINLETSEIRADMNVVCLDQYGEIIPLHDITISIPNFYMEEGEIKYKITDTAIGLVPITFSASVDSMKSVIYPENI